MKENQKLAFKIIFMSVIVLSCADSNVRPINYSNETVKNNEIELSKLEEKKTSEDKTSACFLRVSDFMYSKTNIWVMPFGL